MLGITPFFQLAEICGIAFFIFRTNKHQLIAKRMRRRLCGACTPRRFFGDGNYYLLFPFLQLSFTVNECVGDWLGFYKLPVFRQGYCYLNAGCNKSHGRKHGLSFFRFRTGQAFHTVVCFHSLLKKPHYFTSPNSLKPVKFSFLSWNIFIFVS